ncbi:hypothetical protein EDD17DRAFT_1517477 [Pisolithus thermaeus]|nr:hypothetical protein EDD17DRAFT_1517477 [Pisolithus thermaeus]
MTLKAERLQEVAACYSSEATRLQTIHDTLCRTWEESIICECLQQWFTECLCKDLEYVDLPTHLEAQRDPPYSAQVLEEFTTSGFWEKLKEEQVLTSVIASFAAAFGAAMQTDSDDVGFIRNQARMPVIEVGVKSLSDGNSLPASKAVQAPAHPSSTDASSAKQ